MVPSETGAVLPGSGFKVEWLPVDESGDPPPAVCDVVSRGWRLRLLKQRAERWVLMKARDGAPWSLYWIPWKLKEPPADY